MKKTGIDCNRLLILADDLTGALDTGVQFAKKGFKTTVSLSPDNFSRGDAAVYVINTNTRHTDAREAKKIVKAAVSGFTGNSTENTNIFIYKKTDSCLRGNIGAELEAVMKAAQSSLLPFIPAYPRLNRTTLKGRQYIDDIPIEKSGMANDPLNPITESYIPLIIAKQSKVQVISISDLSEGSFISSKGILLFDSEKTSQLKTIAKWLYKNNLLKFTAGCAGFAETLAGILPLEKNVTSSVSNLHTGKSSAEKYFAKKYHAKKYPVLIISGSLHPVSVNQIKAAVNDGNRSFTLNAAEITKTGWTKSREAGLVVNNTAAALREKHIAIIGTDAALGKNGVRLSEGVSEQIPDIIGPIIKKIIAKTGPVHLVVFGGDTLLGVMKSLMYNCILPITEIKPGVVLSMTEKGGSLLVSKAGAFGGRNIIGKILEFFEVEQCTNIKPGEHARQKSDSK